MTAEEMRTASGLLQRAANVILAGSPDRLDVSVVTDPGGHESFFFGFETWSPALRRSRIEGYLPLHIADPALWPMDADGDLDEAAIAVVRDLFGRHFEEMKKRHDQARALGLVSKTRLKNLPTGRIVIDRTLKALLTKEGYDARRVAAMIADRRTSSAFWSLFNMVSVRRPGHSFRVELNEFGVPEISAWIRMGDAGYNGGILELPFQLLSSVASAAIGLPLGKLVHTGLAELDERAIVAVRDELCTYDGDQWERGSATSLVLEPDRVEVGTGRAVQ